MPDGIVFDKATYNKGDIITMTITDSSRQKTYTVSGPSSDGKSTLTGSFLEQSPNGALVETPAVHVFAKQSDTGTVTVETATA